VVEETGVPGENHRPVADERYYIMLYRVLLAWEGFELKTLVVIGTDCIGSCKSNYHTITATTAPKILFKIGTNGNVVRVNNGKNTFQIRFLAST
jgi:hypothetical protein